MAWNSLMIRKEVFSGWSTEDSGELSFLSSYGADSLEQVTASVPKFPLL